ncbi:hypothetical protein D3C85_1684250 [compost metagenome]
MFLRDPVQATHAAISEWHTDNVQLLAIAAGADFQVWQVNNGLVVSGRRGMRHMMFTDLLALTVLIRFDVIRQVIVMDNQSDLFQLIAGIPLQGLAWL